MTIRKKLIIGFLLIGLIPLIIVSIISFYQSKGELRQQSFRMLNANQSIRKEQVVTFFEERMHDLEVNSTNPALKEIGKKFISAFEEEGHVVGGPRWADLKGQYAGLYRQFIETYGYYDFFFITPGGEVAFTVAEESDLGQPVDGALRVAVEEARKGKPSLADFEWYPPSNDVACFIAAPMMDPENKSRLIGFMALQVSLGLINKITQERVGMGETGETYLVGQDKMMRSDSFLDNVNFSVKASMEQGNKVDTEATRSALAGRTNDGATREEDFIIKDYRNEYVLSSYSLIDLPSGIQWAIISEIDMAEVDQPVNQLMMHILIIMVLVIIIVLFIAIWFGKKIADSIQKVADLVGDVAASVINGDLRQRLSPESVIVDFRDMTSQINNLIEAFFNPIVMTLDYVDHIAKGDIPPEITDTYHGDFNRIKDSLNQCIRTLNTLMADIDGLVDAGINGRLLMRAEATKQQGDYRKIVEGINQIMDSIITLIDLAPTPFMIVDKGFNIQFMNKSGAEILGKTQKELVGLKCYDHFKTDDCQNENCALGKCMRTGQANTSETKAHPQGRDLDIEYRGLPVRDRDGEIIGALEVVMDLTAIKAAQRKTEKIGAYQQVEVKKLLDRLELLAAGRLDFETTIAKPDEDTEQTSKNFIAINKSVVGVKNALGQLITDAQELVHSATDGKLKKRVNPDKHNGAYKDLVQGINSLFDAVINPINEAMEVMHELANKNMTARVRNNYKGDLNTFKQNINNAGDNLEDALSQVDRAVQQISSASGEIANGSQSLASGSSEQASSLEEIAASLEQMNSLTLNNAESAKQGMSLSEESLKHVDSGNNAMFRMNSAMASITQSAHETSNIIKTINDIAFQTNLLALNAAVEAAHAGEAGKGFAVVAEEVKNLALRSAEAARNTDELIETSLKNSEEGAKIVEEVTKSFGNIQTSFSKVNDIVKEISVSSDEQAKGIRQVNLAVGELNKVTQGNAANAEESASAAEELNSQASELRAMVNEFTLTKSRNAAMNRRFEDRQPRVAAPGKQKALPGPSNKYAGDDIEIVLPMDDGYEYDGKDF